MSSQPITVATMRTVPRPNCPICGSLGIDEYHGLKDGLYGTPGQWDMKKCPQQDCGAFWLDPMPHADDLSLAYRGYYTHRGNVSPRNSLANRTRDALVSFKLGYPQRQPLQFDSQVCYSIFQPAVPNICCITISTCAGGLDTAVKTLLRHGEGDDLDRRDHPTGLDAPQLQLLQQGPCRKRVFTAVSRPPARPVSRSTHSDRSSPG